MIAFEPYGPFKVPIQRGGIDKSREREFWDAVEDVAPDLPNAVGCYIFAIRAGRGVRPWYVGKTEKAGFRKEVFQDHKFRLYWEILKDRRKGTALLYFLAKHTGSGRFAKPSTNGHSSIAVLEELLIGTSLLRNSKLVNKRTTKHFKELQVPGYMNETPGARSQKARELATLLGVGHNVR